MNAFGDPFWDVEVMYEALKLKSQKICRKFVSERKDQWLSYAHKWIGTGQLIHSQMSKEKHWLDACLPHTSLSSALLVSHLYVWAWGAGNNGGLANRDDRRACDLLVQGFVAKAIGTGSKQCKVFIDAQWMPRL